MLDLLAMSNVCPGSDKLEGLTLLVVNNLESILDPYVIPVSMPKSIFEGASALCYEGTHFFEETLGIIRMNAVGPEFRIFNHLPLGKAHNRLYISTDERTRVSTTNLSCVQNPRRDSEQVL